MSMSTPMLTKPSFAKYFLICLNCLFVISCTKSTDDLATTTHQTPANTAYSQVDAAMLQQGLQQSINNNKSLGGSLLVYQNGKEVFYGNVGLADRESNTHWRRDTLVNIYSMTKAVTGVALMSLFDEGLFKLNDPLAKYLPEFANPMVLTGMDENGEPLLIPAQRPILIIDLFRHTAGLGYGWEGNYIAQEMNRLNPFDPNKTIAQFSQEVASLPLHFQPGQRWQYSVSVDIQARLAEVLANKPYEQLVQEKVLGPLQMNNTTYFVENNKKPKVSAVYIKQEDGSFEREPNELVYGFMQNPPTQINGGHGLISTADDFMKFALMLQNKGSFQGTRILEESTVELMSKDHLPNTVEDISWLAGKGQMGFGLDFAVRIAAPINKDELYGEVGEFFWDGRATTLFWVDPKNDITVVYLTQVVPFDLSLHADIRKLVYQALDKYTPPNN